MSKNALSDILHNLTAGGSASNDHDGHENRVRSHMYRVWHHACERPKRPCNDCIYRWSEIETGKKKLRKAKERV